MLLIYLVKSNWNITPDPYTNDVCDYISFDITNWSKATKTILQSL